MVESTGQWFLKRGGVVYGPVTPEVLLDWARSGRIRPDDQVSQDNVQWRAPSEVDFLEMEWMIETPDGHGLGPVNIRSLIQPLLNGTVAPDTIARRAADGRSSAIALLIIEELLSELREPTMAGGQKAGRLEELQHELEEARRDSAQLKQEVQRLRAQLADREQSRRESTMAPPPAEAPPLMRDEIDRMKSALEQRCETITRLQNQLAEALDDARREREEADRLRSRLHELARSYDELLRSYRDLHARVVRKAAAEEEKNPPPDSAPQVAARATREHSKIRLI